MIKDVDNVHIVGKKYNLSRWPTNPTHRSEDERGVFTDDARLAVQNPYLL